MLFVCVYRSYEVISTLWVNGDGLINKHVMERVRYTNITHTFEQLAGHDITRDVDEH